MTRASSLAPSLARGRLTRLWRRLRGGALSGPRAGASVAVGLFIGCQPLYGLHLPLCLAVCLPLRLDAVTAYIAANISNPLFAPFLVTAELQVGSLLLDGRLTTPSEIDPGFAWRLGLGSLIVGLLLAAIGGLAAATLVGRRTNARDRNELEQAVSRTSQRYANAARGDRYYVVGKLSSDPVAEQVAALGDLGRVVDAACGRGQLGLCLLELGVASSLRGFDADERKVATARTAGGDDAVFEVADVRDADLSGADTLLLIDVLHYLDRAEQDRLLERAACALEAGGTLVVRELDVAAGISAWPAIWAEKLARVIGYNRGSTLEFRPIRETVAALERHGFECTLEPSGGLANALVVARLKASSR